MKPLKKAISVYGRQHIANATGVSLIAVSRWTKVGVPPKHCKTIEAITDGLVTAHELRPDVFPHQSRQIPGNHLHTTLNNARQ